MHKGASGLGRPWLSTICTARTVLRESEGGRERREERQRGREREGDRQSGKERERRVGDRDRQITRKVDRHRDKLGQGSRFAKVLPGP